MQETNVEVKKNKNFWQKAKHELIDFPLYIAGHPFKGFGDIKFEGEGSVAAGVVILVLTAFVQILSYVYTGYVFNNNDPYELNIIILIIIAVLPTLLFTVGNWSITTLMEGTGSMKDIFLVFTYSQYLPLICSIISLILSNVLVEDEAGFYTFFQTLGVILFALYAFIGLVTVHEFGFFKSLTAIVLTFVAIFIILFLAVLLVALAGEFAGFVNTVVREIILHLS